MDRKIILGILLAFSALVVKGGEEENTFKFGLGGELNFYPISGSSFDDKFTKLEEFKALAFGVGINGTIEYLPIINSSFGLGFFTGFSFGFAGSIDGGESVAARYDMSIPLSIVYRNWSSNVRFGAFAGYVYKTDILAGHTMNLGGEVMFSDKDGFFFQWWVFSPKLVYTFSDGSESDALKYSRFGIGYRRYVGFGK